MSAAARAKAAAGLPEAYAEFAPVFERLSEPLQQTLRGQLEQFELLAPALGAMEVATLGEFDGLGGLTHRGDIAHILQSGLLLRTEAPLEFLRRLAESETLFHEKQFLDPGAKSVYRAMISIGPGSMGHGRVLALAALFFLARIAHGRGAAFHWCFLPQAERAAWFEGLSVNGVKRLLRAASYREMSRDDAAEAAELFDSERPSPARGVDLQMIDWAIGARPRRPAPAGEALAAVEASENRLSYDLSIPRPGVLREAEIQVRRRGRDAARTSVPFPDDRVCASALREPFRPLAPAARAAAPSKAPRVRPGWEPQHFAITHPDSIVVRMHDGLLLLSMRNQAELVCSHFFPLGAETQLAGLTLRRDSLAILTHLKGSRSSFGFGRYTLAPDGARLMREGKVDSYSEHLLRKQAPYAIPSLHAHKTVTFHSPAGQAYELSPDTADAARFRAAHNGETLLHSTGVHHVVRTGGSRPELQVRKPGGEPDAIFSEGAVPIAPDRLLGMVYSHSERALAYSATPNIWTIPPSHETLAREAAAGGEARSKAVEITLKPHESLLSGRLDSGRPIVRIWSDARLGGNGTVRVEHGAGGSATIRQPVIKLGPDAMHIARIDAGQGGLWAVVVDDEGEPLELHLRRPQPTRRHPALTVIDLRDARQRAHPLDAAQLHD